MLNTTILFCLFVLMNSLTPLIAACSFTARNAPINFGNIDPFSSSAVNVTNASVSIACNPSQILTYSITLDAGGDGSITPYRHLLLNGSDSSNILNYNLYQGTSAGTIWGNTIPTGVTRAGKNCNANGNNCNEPIFAQIPLPQPTATVGSYSASVVVNVGLSPAATGDRLPTLSSQTAVF